MDTSLLVRLFGFPATLTHGDTSVLDRWRWLKPRLPATANGERVLDVGCGTGAFTIGAARRGYHSTGISWDARNQQVADARAKLCGVTTATFVVGDVRALDAIPVLEREYDVMVCLECIEHILDDLKIFKDMAARLAPGGRLLLTTPNFYYVPISPKDRGPFVAEETGWHVRRGYTPAMLRELCERSGLVCGDVTYCTGFLSQMVSKLWRVADTFITNRALHWLALLPFRVIPIVLLDDRLTRLIDWPFFSVCLEAYKPRYPA